jgi:hypothetical protein
MYNNVAGDTNKGRSAKDRFQSRLAGGVDRQNRLIRLVSDMTITDGLAAPGRMMFSWDRQLHVTLHDKVELTVHPHALGQISGVFEYPKIYVNKLSKGAAGIPLSKCRQKMVDDLNWHAHESKG